MNANCTPNARPSSATFEQTGRDADADHLFLLATERFCSADTHDRLSMHHFQLAFEQLYQVIGSPCLQIAARLLAFSAHAPRSIILQLALEDTSISRPVLLHSPVLGQLDMMRLIETCGADHSALIAQRYDIGPTVLGRLRQFGAAAVVHALSENPAVPNPPVTARQQLKETGTVRGDRENETVSVSRPVTADGDEAQPLTGNERRLLDLAGLSDKGLQAAVPSAKEVGGATQIRVHGSRLEKLAEVNNHQKLAQAMSAISGISLKSAYQVLEQQSGISMAVFLKSIEIDDACASRILMLGFPAIGLSIHNATGMVRFYSKLDAKNCRTAVAKWPTAKAPAVHQTVYEQGTSTPREELEFERRPLPGSLPEHRELTKAG